MCVCLVGWLHSGFVCNTWGKCTAKQQGWKLSKVASFCWQRGDMVDQRRFTGAHNGWRSVIHYLHCKLQQLDPSQEAHERNGFVTVVGRETCLLSVCEGGNDGGHVFRMTTSHW